MRPLDTRVAVLHGWRLVFDLPVGKGERGVANLLAVPGQHTVGVAYAISDEQARDLDRTEGVPRAYRRVGVDLLTTDGAGFAAFTYVSPHRRMGCKPSRRYMGLLLQGARHHGLPGEWIETLRAFPLAVDERSPQLELYPEKDP
ncbi:MAG: gamma-glutamylcyclotransferase [Myxococcota bacterium]|nr:gamma-glutamylcyclotransferase [Myxococcota bacterium]